jgi:hypothetical protein
VKSPRIGLHTLLLFAAAIALAGASSKAQAQPPARDKYDPTGMVLKVLDQRIGAKAGS